MKFFLLSLVAMLVLSMPTFAQTDEIEGGDSLATSQQLSLGELVVHGNLGGGTPRIVADTALLSDTGTIATDGTNAVVSFDFGVTQGLTASTEYVIFQGGDNIDTRLGQFDTSGTGGTEIQDVDFLTFNETFDGSSDANGDLFLSVAAFQNTSYDPAYTGPGDVGDISVDIFEILAPAMQNMTADFYTFSGLIAGAEYTATTGGLNGTSPDTLLALYDASGNNIAEDDDIGNGSFFSEFTFIADSSGIATLAVSGFDDAGGGGELNGFTSAAGFGDYSLTLVTSVPEPMSTTIICLAGLVGMARRRRS